MFADWANSADQEREQRGQTHVPNENGVRRSFCKTASDPVLQKERLTPFLSGLAAARWDEVTPVAPVFEPVADVFASITPVFEPVADVLTPVPPILEPVPQPAVMASVAAVFEPVAQILAPIPPIFQSIPPVFAPVAHILDAVTQYRTTGRTLCHQWSGTNHDEQRRSQRIHCHS